MWDLHDKSNRLYILAYQTGLKHKYQQDRTNLCNTCVEIMVCKLGWLGTSSVDFRIVMQLLQWYAQAAHTPNMVTQALVALAW